MRSLVTLGAEREDHDANGDPRHNALDAVDAARVARNSDLDDERIQRKEEHNGAKRAQARQLRKFGWHRIALALIQVRLQFR